MPDFYRVYRGQDGVIDYDNPVAVMALDDEQVSIPSQALPPNTNWHYVRRRVSGDCELESQDSPSCIVRIDSNGDMLGSIPNAPTKLAAEGLADGKIKLRWRYAPSEEEIAPTGFHIYIDSGAGFDFETPDAIIPYHGGGPKAGEFNWTSEPLINGEIYRFCVRSYRINIIPNYYAVKLGSSGTYWDNVDIGTFKPWFYENLGVWIWRNQQEISFYLAPAFEPVGRYCIDDQPYGTGSGWRNETGILGTYTHGTEPNFDIIIHEIDCEESQESQNTNSVSITADSVGPEAITNLIASVEEI